MRRPELLPHLRCPETRLPLRLADTAELTAFNRLVAVGMIVSRDGKPVTAPWAEALMRSDGRVLYHVHDGVPQLLVEAGVDRGQGKEP